MATNVGRVGIVMKGDWSNSATYDILDAVTYSGSLYIAKQSVPANTLPTNTTYWQLSADISSKVATIVFRSVVIPFDIGANGTYHTNLYTAINNDMPAGNRFLGIAGYESGYGQMLITSMAYHNDAYSLVIRDLSGSAHSETQVTIFYLMVQS